MFYFESKTATFLILINFYNVIILAAIVIMCLVSVFFILDQTYFENDAKQICDLKDA